MELHLLYTIFSMIQLSKKVIFIITADDTAHCCRYFIWQKYKYKFARNTLKSTVKEQTDSLYSIKYDSLSFDAVSGHANMKNIRIVPDTDRIKSMDVENMPDILLDVTIKSLVVTGVQTAKALNGNKMEGDSVIINAPQIILYSLKPLQKRRSFKMKQGTFTDKY